ncbi:P-loop containing nucleoside triphosphate hydrolase protein [Pseudoneurospora amorphoporcata]|uniref:P-loop containing nucleoside triphosphate hydrolase protein n=1 Tax=Pseudoneurospora amorphoporcata TaxID=241081 RepID=A0AAN6SHH8_9PEZI|nr:P-loop containing nucleoside triphosphate hydrolase protein [Pseudoneurospora amorphoporcata]
MTRSRSLRKTTTLTSATMGSEVKPPASGTLTSPDRLRKIDQLREKNIDVILPLPTLVAVGDQSSGKSSLLESVTGIPFPRGQELCTRYATQITHRRDPEVQIIITIIPAPQSTEAEKASLRSYRKELSSTNELRDQFVKILDEVNVYMKIKTDKNPEGEKTFSRDILKIEKCGPTEDYLTVIDVPGIFRLTSKGQTTESDRHLVRDMVTGFIKDKRTIILAVLPANVDVMTQEILALAEQYDPDGERTLGVLTKPDLVIERSAKEAVCNLVAGRKKALNLGYYLVKNRGGDDDDDSDDDSGLRRKERDLFQQSPWCNLPQERVGVAALRERLQDLLGEITDKAYPELRSEARKKLAEARDQRDALGPPRQTEREQQQYLAQIAAKFQQIVRAALEANYSTHSVFDEHSRRLITRVMGIVDTFNDRMRRKGHTYSFVKMETEDSDDDSASDADDGEDDDPFSEAEQEAAQRNESYFKMARRLFPELESIINMLEQPEFAVKHDNSNWIRNMYLESRGIELGTFSPIVLASAFRDQTTKWGPMTEYYVSTIIMGIHHFILSVLKGICADGKLYEAIKSIIMDDLLARYANGLNHAKFLVQVERETKPYTVNHYFSSNLQKSRGDRVSEALKGKRIWDGHCHSGGAYVVKFDHVKSAITNKSNTEHAQDDIHDILKSYYKVSRKRFVDNVWLYAVDHHLLSGPNSPLTLFSEQWVLGLDEDSLNAIAGESRSTRDKRKELTKKIVDLEEALRILK